MIKVFCQAFFQKSLQKSRESNVQTCILGVALNELLAGFHLLAHQDAERLVGALGIAIVASTSWCTLRVGASVFLAISTAGQIISSQLIDQFGFFGMPVQKFNVKQIPGYVLLAAGVALVVTG